MKKANFSIRLTITIALIIQCLVQNTYGQKAGSTDYLKARTRFNTSLIKHGGSPQQPEATDSADVPPAGVSQVFFKSGNNLTLKAWINAPKGKFDATYPAIVFLHGGLAFGKGDWDMTQPFRDAGFIVVTPMLRGENAQPGTFTFLYNEVNDAIAAAEYLRQQPFIDHKRIYLAGHSVGGILTLLTAMSTNDFTKAASFSGLPDMVSYYRYVIDPKQIPFDTTCKEEFVMRSPAAYAASFKCPVRLYFGTEEPWIMGSSSVQTAATAKGVGIDAKAVAVQGGHMSAVQGEMELAIRFFNKQ